MASEPSFELKFNGLDEDLLKVLQEYPDRTERFMQNEARKWKKLANSKGYGKYPEGKGAILKNGKKKRSSLKAWKNVKETNILGQVTEIQIQNRSRLFHLIENGHVKWLFGKNTGGYVPGKHWAEQAREEFKEVFPRDTENYVKAMLKEYKL